MAIDLSRFHQTFFDESGEGLEVMEQALLRLETGAADSDTINLIFRAAHSIKGGAATFGFTAVADFTHHVETLLDSMRSGKRGVDRPVVDLLLRAKDATRELLEAAQRGGKIDEAAIASLQVEVKAALEGAPATVVAAAPVAAPAPKASGFEIRFVPKVDLFRSGNDTLRILRELGTLGEMDIALDTSAAPSFADLDPESSYLAWTLKLHGDCKREAVQEVFAWVEDECDLTVTALEAAVPAGVAQAVEQTAAEAAPAASEASAPKLTLAASAPVAAKKAEKPGTPETSSIRVSIDKIDNLINLVSELVITQAMLAQQAGKLGPIVGEQLLNGLQHLERNTRGLQEAVMATRMLPIDAVFSRFPRMVHDLAAKLGKQVHLHTIGEATELDKGVIEKIADPLTHLVRNCVDHGIEPVEDRVANGKEAAGNVVLKAYHQGGQIVIEIEDDGRGLNRSRIIEKARANGIAISDEASDPEVFNIIFTPGFSTVDKVTDISGRGVGMDVVKRNIQALGGQVELASMPGQGTRTVIRLPLTLAIVDGMLVSVGGETFVIPLNCVVESLQPAEEQIKSVAGQGKVVRLRDDYLPLLPLYRLFNLKTDSPDPCQSIIVVLEVEGRKIALQVDSLVGQQQVVIKNLEANYRRVSGVAGATILGDGRVALILDGPELVRGSHQAMAA